DQVDLVDRGDKVLDAEELRDARVPVGLAQHTGAGIDQQDGDVGVGSAGEHVACVPLMAGRVRQDVAAGIGREEPGRDVDGYPLLPLSTQAIGKSGQVGDPFLVGDRLEMVERQTVGVVQQPADQRALAVVDGSRGSDPQQLARRRHQKYPSRLRSSIAATDVRSSARVSPRSETVAAEISSMTRSMSTARERTAPVIVRSPTVRYRTHSTAAVSPLAGSAYSETASRMPSRSK